MHKTKNATTEYKVLSPFMVKEDSEDSETLTIEGYANYSGDLASGEIYCDAVGDVVVPSGMDVTQYKKNPQILWQHDRRNTVGKALEVTKKKDGIYLKAEIHKSAMDEKDYYKVKSGLISYFSIGFRCKKVEWKEVDGKEVCFIIKSELFETSIVGLPCNGESKFSVAKAYGTEGFFAGDLFEEAKQDSNTTQEEDETMRIKFRDLLPAEKVKELEELGLQDELDAEREISLVKYLEKYRTELEASVKNIVLTTLKEVEDKAKEEAEAKAKADLEAEKEKTQAELAEKLGVTIEEVKSMTEEEIEAKIKSISDEDEIDVKAVEERLEAFKKSLEELAAE